jgi:hypothetical protein
MLRQDDLDVAVGRGIITPEQADEVIAIAAARHRKRAFAVGREERFRLLGGFNDFFIAIGVVLLGIGLLFAPDVVAGGRSGSQMIAAGAVCAAAMWGLSEWLTARLRLTAPSIVLAVLWVLSVTTMLAGLLGMTSLMAGGTPQASFLSAGALVAAAVHYVRFRLPFMLVLVPLCALAAACFLARQITHGSAPTSWIVFLIGVATFVAAMRFDLADPERLTRRADCGFWLHLAAAPMIVHPVIGALNGQYIFGTLSPSYSASQSVTLVILATLVLAIVALVIDRRALLVAGLGYLGAAIAYLITQIGASAGLASIGTLVFLGASIIVLGTGWRGLRAAMMGALPDFPLKNRFPPYIGS